MCQDMFPIYSYLHGDIGKMVLMRRKLTCHQVSMIGHRPSPTFCNIWVLSIDVYHGFCYVIL